MLFKHDVQGNFFDSNCVEMGVEAVEMDWEDGKLRNNIKLVSIEKSHDELFTSGKALQVCMLFKLDVQEQVRRDGCRSRWDGLRRR